MKTITKISAKKALNMVTSKMEEFSFMEITRKIDLIIENIKNTDGFNYSQNVLIYPGGYNDRERIIKLINFFYDAGKSVYIPYYNENYNRVEIFPFWDWNSVTIEDNGLIKPKFNVYNEYNNIDLVIIPGSVVSANDMTALLNDNRFKETLLSTTAQRFAVNFELQLTGSVEPSPNVISVDKIITEYRIFRRNSLFTAV